MSKRTSTVAPVGSTEGGDIIIIASDRVGSYDTELIQQPSSPKMETKFNSPDTKTEDDLAPMNIHLAHEGVASDSISDIVVESITPDLSDTSDNPKTAIITVTTLIANQDVYTDATAVSGAGNNFNGSNLTMNGVALTSRRAWIKWHLGNFDISGVTIKTVTSATLHWYTTVNATGSAPFTIAQLANGNENWAEGSMTNNSAPAVGGALQSSVNLGAVGSQSVALSVAARSRIADRFGVGNMTFVCTPDATVALDVAMQSKDSGGSPGNASGPRLTFTIQLTF